MSPADFFFSQDVETGRNNRGRLMQEGYWEGEFRFRHPKTGEPIPLHFLSVLIRDPQTGRPTGGASIGRDLSQQRLAHQKLLEKTADLELLKAVAVASNQAVDLDEAMKIAVTEICRLTHWPVGHVYLLSEDGKTLRPSGIWYFDEPERFETFRKVTEATTFLAGEGLPGRILASGKPLAIPDVTMDSNFPRARKTQDTQSILMVVVFPAPFGPRKANSSPGGDLERKPLNRHLWTVELGRVANVDHGNASSILSFERERFTLAVGFLFQHFPVRGSNPRSGDHFVSAVLDDPTRDSLSLPVEISRFRQHFPISDPSFSSFCLNPSRCSACLRRNVPRASLSGSLR